MFLDLINTDKLARAAKYALLMAVCMILQNSVLSSVEVLGTKCLFLPAAAVAVGMFEGGVWGGVFGLIMGLLTDMGFSENTVLFTVLFPILGFFSGALTAFFVNKRFFAYFILSLAALVLTAAAQIAGLWLFRDADAGALLITAAKQTLWSLPFTVPLYFACRGLSGRNADRN